MLSTCAPATRRRSLVSTYSTGTAAKTRDAIRVARGGVLFLDEAHRLVPPDGDRSGGREALQEIMAAMSGPDADIAVIFATYPEYRTRIMAVDAGLERRFAENVVFADYDDEALAEILVGAARDDGYAIDGALAGRIAARVGRERGKPGFGNAGRMLNIFERASMARAERLQALPEPPREAVRTLTEEDFYAELAPPGRARREGAAAMSGPWVRHTPLAASDASAAPPHPANKAPA